ncbi:MAG: transcription elongation factor GreA [Clostridiales bacterium]|nr:transcription elongation factor GreA [Clostridiales bacterium]
MAKPMVLTAEGLKKMTDELDYLKNIKRVEVKENLAIARSFGDLSENSEYDEAKNEQAKVETRINELEEILKNVVVINENELADDIANVGMTVKVYDEEFDEEVEYNIVGSNEADPLKNNISDQSPIGMAIIGKHVDEIAEVEAPSGIIKLKILEIKRKS